MKVRHYFFKTLKQLNSKGLPHGKEHSLEQNNIADREDFLSYQIEGTFSGWLRKFGPHRQNRARQKIFRKERALFSEKKNLQFCKLFCERYLIVMLSLPTFTHSYWNCEKYIFQFVPTHSSHRLNYILHFVNVQVQAWDSSKVFWKHDIRLSPSHLRCSQR
jgi:hypothetical protein